MEEHRESHRILDYSLSQTTLDDVFVTFAQSQKDNEPDATDAKPTTEDVEDRRSEGGSIVHDKRRKHKREPLKVKSLEVRPRASTLGRESLARRNTFRETMNNPNNRDRASSRNPPHVVLDASQDIEQKPLVGEKHHLHNNRGDSYA